MKFVLLRKVFPLALLLFVTLACGLIPNLKKELDKASKPVRLTSADGRYEITVPGGWREDRELNAQADLTASNRLQELYVVILNENKQDFADDSTLQNFTWTKRESGMSYVSSQVTTDPMPIIINGYPAMQFEVHGVVDHMKIGYIVTTIETSGSYHYVISWTLESAFAANKAALQQVIQSFKETANLPSLPPGKSAPSPPAPASSATPTASTRSR
jgi:hypothetical protein